MKPRSSSVPATARHSHRYESGAEGINFSSAFAPRQRSTCPGTRSALSTHRALPSLRQEIDVTFVNFSPQEPRRAAHSQLLDENFNLFRGYLRERRGARRYRARVISSAASFRSAEQAPKRNRFRLRQASGRAQGAIDEQMLDAPQPLLETVDEGLSTAQGRKDDQYQISDLRNSFSMSRELAVQLAISCERPSADAWGCGTLHDRMASGRRKGLKFFRLLEGTLGRKSSEGHGSPVRRSSCLRFDFIPIGGRLTTWSPLRASRMATGRQAPHQDAASRANTWSFAVLPTMEPYPS